MNDITLQKLRAWRACWYDDGADGDAEYHRHVGSLDPISLVDALKLETVPIIDRIWLACRALPAREARLFACDCAERALSRIANPDPRSVAAIAVSRRYAHGEATDDELKAAEAAAWDAAEAEARAAWAAAARAAWAEARAAAAEAARAAAAAAEAEAARAAAAAAAAAAWAAEAAAAWAAEAAAAAEARDWQLERALEYARNLEAKK